MGELKVSNSEIRAFKRCRRKWYFTYVRQLQPMHEGPGPLRLGNMVHHVMEAYYTPTRTTSLSDFRASFKDEVLDPYVAERLAELPEVMHGDMLKDRELAHIMVDGYLEWLEDEGADMDLEILAAEQEMEAYLGQIEGVDVSLMAKLDVEVLVRSTGDRAFIDHKTVANLADLPKTAALDEQQLMYGLIQRLRSEDAGERVTAGLFNMLRKVKRTAKANPPFYGRYSVRHSDEEYRQFYLRVWGEVKDMLTVRARLEAGEETNVVCYPNPTRDCSWDCPFFAVCQMCDDGSDLEAVIPEMYEVGDPYARYTEIEKG